MADTAKDDGTFGNMPEAVQSGLFEPPTPTAEEVSSAPVPGVPAPPAVAASSSAPAQTPGAPGPDFFERMAQFESQRRAQENYNAQAAAYQQQQAAYAQAQRAWQEKLFAPVKPEDENALINDPKAIIGLVNETKRSAAQAVIEAQQQSEARMQWALNNQAQQFAAYMQPMLQQRYEAAEWDAADKLADEGWPNPEKYLPQVQALMRQRPDTEMQIHSDPKMVELALINAMREQGVRPGAARPPQGPNTPRYTPSAAATGSPAEYPSFGGADPRMIAAARAEAERKTGIKLRPEYLNRELVNPLGM